MKKVLNSIVFIIILLLVNVGLYFLIDSTFENSLKYMHAELIKLISTLLTLFFGSLIIWIRKENLVDILVIHKTHLKNIRLCILVGILLGIIPFAKYITMIPEISDLLNITYLISSKYFLRILKNTVLITIYSYLIYIPIIIFSEFIFRGLIQSELRKILNIKIAVVLQALIAGLLVYILEFNLLNASGTIIIGIVLGTVCYATKSIWSSILLNMILIVASSVSVFLEKLCLLYNPVSYNTADIISSYVANHSLIENQPSLVFSPFYIVFIAIDFAIIIIILLYLIKSKRLANENDKNHGGRAL